MVWSASLRSKMIGQFFLPHKANVDLDPSVLVLERLSFLRDPFCFCTRREVFSRGMFITVGGGLFSVLSLQRLILVSSRDVFKASM